MASAPASQAQWSSWLWATRPFSLSASLAPVLVGTGLAAGVGGATDWALFVLALTGSVAIQIGTNLTDEYTDHHQGRGAGKFLAPHKVIQRGLLSERAVRGGMGAAFGYGIAAGLAIVWQLGGQAGWPILAVGIASVAVAYLYAGGPKPLGALGLGEPLVFLFMGPVMVGASYYVQVQEVSAIALWASLPVGCIVTAILHANNLRDIEEDRAAGKRSIAALIGLTPSRWVYAGLVGTAFAVIAALGATGTPSPWTLLGLAPAPWAYAAARGLFRADDRAAMNRMLVRSAKLHGWTGLSLAGGLAAAAL